MNSSMLIDLCQRIRPELACLGELGRLLLDVVTVIERVGAARDVTVLSEPGFALDVLTSAGAGSDAAVVGRVLDFLRIRAHAGPASTTTDRVCQQQRSDRRLSRRCHSLRNTRIDRGGPRVVAGQFRHRGPSGPPRERDQRGELPTGIGG